MPSLRNAGLARSIRGARPLLSTTYRLCPRNIEGGLRKDMKRTGAGEDGNGRWGEGPITLDTLAVGKPLLGTHFGLGLIFIGRS